MAIGLMLLLILILALFPAVLSLWQLYHLDRRMQRIRASNAARLRRLERPHRASGIRYQNASVPEFRYIDGVGYVIGDLSCEFNAKSPYVRCAVNPMGPCQGCRAYQAKALETTAFPQKHPSANP